MPIRILRRSPLPILLVLSLVAAGIVVGELAPVSADNAQNCLPSAMDSGKTVVRVGSDAELRAAIGSVSPNTVIVIEPGGYNIARSLQIRAHDVTLRLEGQDCLEHTDLLFNATASPPSPPNPEPSTPEPPAPSPQVPQLVNQDDVNYQGSFRVPAGAGSTESSLSWGGAGLAYNPANDSLFITGHSWHQLTAEISIPTHATAADAAALPQASFLQHPEDATDGKLSSISEPASPTFDRIGGYLIDGSDLIVSGYNFYDASDDQTRSHLATSTDLGSSSDFVALTDEVQPRWLGGAMAHIPESWQDAFGGDTFMTGLSGISIVGNSSVGPSAATFTRASLNGADPAQLVLGYPLSDPLGEYDVQSEVWNGTSEVRGMVFPDGFNSVLYFGTHGVGNFCYGTGPQCGDPVQPYQGTHAYPYRYQMWAYNASDLAAVHGGEASPEETQPYDVWELPLPYSPERTEIGGAAYDAETGRIFISQAFADGDNPVIHVFTIG